MSNPQNIHRKILVNHPLKTNFISNTHNNTKQKCSNEKRFSNIAREKQTIQKNTARYYEQIDMQGSATIIPQHKNPTRPNQYINQNTNVSNLNTLQHAQNNINNNNYGQRNNNIQFISHINNKNKSPGQNGRLNIDQLNNKNSQHLNNKNSQHLNNKNIEHLSNKNIEHLSNKNIEHLSNKNIEHLNSKGYPISIKKNLIQFNRNTQVQTQRQRQKSLKSFLINNNKQTKQKEQQKQTIKCNQNKIKNTYSNNIKLTNNQIDDDLLCDQEMDLNLPQQKKQLTQSYEYESEQLNHHKTQKKYIFDKPTILLQKTKSQHSLLHLKDSATININNNNSNLNNTINNNNKYHQPLLNINKNTRLNNTRNNIPSIYQQQLKKFNFYQHQINIVTQIQKLQILSQRHKQYSVQPNYIQLKQKNFNWYMRAVLMDWMVHVCYQFCLRRQTYYIAVGIADKYLQKTNDLPKSQFQLVGAASMYLAAKLQQFQALSAADFSKSTDNRYSPVDIKQMQLKICKTLNYQINPPTLYMWANRFMAHWDNYIMLTHAKEHSYFNIHSPKYFKKDSQQSYLLFRQMVQMLDCSILDVQTLQFPPKILICSFMYLVLGKNYKQWPIKRIVEQFPRSSHYLVSEDSVDENCFNNLFHMFLIDSFSIDIQELLPAVQYCSTYFTLPLNFDQPPIAIKNQNQQQNHMSLQQYQSYQTYNGKMIDLVKKRYRGVYL